MEASLAYFDETLNRLNASLGQLEGMMGRVMRTVDLAEAAMSPVAAARSAVRGVLNVFGEVTPSSCSTPRMTTTVSEQATIASAHRNAV